MTHYYAIIKYLYPNIQDEEFHLTHLFHDNGTPNIFLSKWRYKGAKKPKLEELDKHKDKAELHFAIENKKLLFRKQCTQEIQSGFTCVIGKNTYTYPSKEGEGYYDQSNLYGGAPVSLWRQDEKGEWEFVLHNQEELQVVQSVFNAHKENLRGKCKEICDQLNAAKSFKEMGVVQWESCSMG